GPTLLGLLRLCRVLLRLLVRDLVGDLGGLLLGTRVGGVRSLVLRGGLVRAGLRLLGVARRGRLVAAGRLLLAALVARGRVVGRADPGEVGADLDGLVLLDEDLQEGPRHG